MPSIRFFITLLCFTTYYVSAQVKLPRLISDGMVLQRDANVNIWGWAAKDEKVSVVFNGKSFQAVADSNSKWAIMLPKMKAGGPYSMDITASNQLHINNILVGDVWLCSGQSNMVLNMERVKEKYPEEITIFDCPEQSQTSPTNILFMCN